MEKVIYRSVAREAKIEIIEKKSRFIGHVKPVQSSEEAEAFLEGIRAKHSTATHNVWAYRLGLSGEQQRFSDDGEPSQTAGMPTLDVILKQDITQLIIVTTRYFGGILLGAGGLVRAYSKSASEAIQAAGITSYVQRAKYRVTVNYSEWGIVENFCQKRRWALSDVEYMENVSVTVTIPEYDKEALVSFLQDTSSGRVEPIFVGNVYLQISSDSPVN